MFAYSFINFIVFLKSPFQKTAHLYDRLKQIIHLIFSLISNLLYSGHKLDINIRKDI